MKKRLLLISISLVLLVLAACGDKDDDKQSGEKGPDPAAPLEVELHVPESGKKDKPIELKTTVKQDGDLVEDASDVQYEVWKEGAKDDSDMVEATNEKDGTYKTDYTFKDDAVYAVQVHVTARDQHQMPVKKIAIGDAELKADKEDHDGEHDGDHHSEDFSMHFMKPEQLKKDEQTELIVHVENDGKALEKANVRYEIWKKDQEKHDWVNAKEIKAGEYEAEHAFKETGTYNIHIHVENDDGLHEHEEHELTVE